MNSSIVHDQKLRSILEAPLSKLYEFEWALTLDANRFDPIEKFIIFGQIAYLSGDELELRNLLEAHRHWSSEPAHLILSLKCECLQFSVSQTLLEQVIALSDKDLSIWSGESAFAAAYAAEILRQEGLASALYAKSANLYQKLGLLKKAVKGKLNALATQSRKAPNANVIQDYWEVFLLGKKAKEYGMAGYALHNISLQLSWDGALILAKKYSDLAIRLLKRDFGAAHYYLAHAHRADILIRLGESERARFDLDVARVSPHREVQAAVHYLDRKLLGDAIPSPVEWKEMATEWRQSSVIVPKVESQHFSLLECQLVEALATGAKTSGELVEMLWRDQLTKGTPHSILYNRLKILINRVRKKDSGILAYENGQYVLGKSRSLALKNDCEAKILEDIKNVV